MLGPSRENYLAGNNFYIQLETESAEEAERIYSKLSEGGKVFMPLDETDWAEKFAMFADKFSVQWMINYGDK